MTATRTQTQVLVDGWRVNCNHDDCREYIDVLGTVGYDLLREGKLNDWYPDPDDEYNWYCPSHRAEHGREPPKQERQ